jgi:hypothetical protein
MFAFVLFSFLLSFFCPFCFLLAFNWIFIAFTTRYLSQLHFNGNVQYSETKRSAVPQNVAKAGNIHWSEHQSHWHTVKHFLTGQCGRLDIFCGLYKSAVHCRLPTLSQINPILTSSKIHLNVILPLSLPFRFCDSNCVFISRPTYAYTKHSFHRLWACHPNDMTWSWKGRTEIWHERVTRIVRFYVGAKASDKRRTRYPIVGFQSTSQPDLF